MLNKQKANQAVNFYLNRKLVIYGNLMLLFFKSFIRNFRNTFFIFVMPVFFMIIFFFVIKGMLMGGSINSIKAGYILLGPITAGITSLSVTIADWKSSIFLKRLDATPVTKGQFLSALVIFYCLISIISSIWLFVWIIIIDPSNSVEYIKTINWGYFILGILLFIILSIGVGLFIGGVSKSQGMAQALALAIYFPSIFLSGIMIPGYAIDGVRDLFNYIGYIFPHKYSASVIVYGWNVNSWYPKTMGSLISDLGFPQLYIPIIVSLGWTAIIYTVTGFTFKWDIRN